MILRAMNTETENNQRDQVLLAIFTSYGQTGSNIAYY